jgi:membrane-associated phospholipid phosphatase
VGLVALGAGSLVGLSTLLTRQHYVLDVLAGGLLAGLAYAVFLHPFPRSRIPVLDRRVAPGLALCATALVGVGLTVYWVAYLLGLKS